jgi:site-specific DNA-methyltransferase (adenine-specific)
MTPYFEDDRATIYHGDCAEVIASLPDASVDCVVTSPPYAEQRATTYGGVPEGEYPAWTVRWTEPLRRVLKPRGSVVINIRPHVHKGVISDYTLHTRLLLRTCGWAELDEFIWFKPQSPPTGHPTRPRRAWESLHWFGLSGDVWCDPQANGRASKNLGMTGKGAHLRQSWDHYQVAGETSEGVARSMDVCEFGIRRPRQVEVGLWDHPAPYPKQVAAWCIRLVCPPGGTVLDPFSGSGSTGVAAIQEGRRYVGIDLAEEYAAMSARRVSKEPDTLDIFGGDVA